MGGEWLGVTNAEAQFERAGDKVDDSGYVLEMHMHGVAVEGQSGKL